MSSDYNSIGEFFSHPLVLLLIGAAISGVLIPYFTNRATNYQKGLEIKTDLVRRINESVMRLVISLEAVVFVSIPFGSESDKRQAGNPGLYSQKKDLEDELEQIKKRLDQDILEESRKKIIEKRQKEVSEQIEKIVKSIQHIEKVYDEATNGMKEWHVTAAVIGSLIKSYFPEFGEKTEAKMRWNAFGEKIKVKLTWNAFIASMTGAFLIASKFYSTALHGYEHEDLSWGQVLADLFYETEEIVYQIQESPISGLSEHLFDRFIRRITGKGKVKQT